MKRKMEEIKKKFKAKLTSYFESFGTWPYEGLRWRTILVLTLWKIFRKWLSEA